MIQIIAHESFVGAKRRAAHRIDMYLVSIRFVIGGAGHCLIAARAHDVRPNDSGVLNRAQYFKRKPLLLHFLDCVDVAQTVPLGSVK